LKKTVVLQNINAAIRFAEVLMEERDWQEIEANNVACVGAKE